VYALELPTLKRILENGNYEEPIEDNQYLIFNEPEIIYNE